MVNRPAVERGGAISAIRRLVGGLASGMAQVGDFELPATRPPVGHEQRMTPMSRLFVACTVAFGIALVAQRSPASTITTPSQDGVTITTTIDTNNHTVTYGFELATLPYDYEQIAFSPSPLPAFTAIPLQAGAVTSPALTEWNFHQLFDGGNFVGWQLELQYMTGSPPPRSNTVTIQYDPATLLSGDFIGLPGDDNVTVTLRRPVGGFPDGQDDNVVLWAYVPEIVPEPASLALILPGLVVLMGKRFSRDRRLHQS